MSGTPVAPPRRRGAALDYAWVYAVAVLAYGAIALWAGQDTNWDLQNYHDYVGYALLHWRYPVDTAPGGPQTYLNPLPYVLPYLIRHHLPMRVGAAVLAAVQALLPVVVWALAGRLLPPSMPRRRAVRAMATFAGATGAMALSEIGTSFADLLLALPCLGALTLLLAADAAPRRRGPAELAAGLLAGAACGLKLTNLYVAGAIGVAALMPWRRHTPATVLRLAAGGALGLLLLGGWWAAYLWTSYGNPMFPFLNAVFRSPAAEPRNFTDARFLPHGLAGLLAYPWRIATGESPSAEVSFADPRLLLGLPVAAGWLLFGLARREMRAEGAPLRAAGFLLAGTGVWLWSVAIQRYAMSFDAVAGVLTVVAAARLSRRAMRRTAMTATRGAAVATLVIFAGTRAADWEHRPWAMRWTAQVPPRAMTADAYVLLAPPSGYWAAALRRAAPVYELHPALMVPGGALTRRTDDGLRAAAAAQGQGQGARAGGGGGIWAIAEDAPIPPDIRAQLRDRGLVLLPACAHRPALGQTPVVFCRAALAGPRRLAAADLPADTPVGLGTEDGGWVYEVEGFSVAEASGLWATGTTSRLALRPVTAAGAEGWRIDLDLGGLRGTGADLAVTVNGRPAGHLVLPDDGTPRWRHVCVPGDARAADGVLDVVIDNPAPRSPREVGFNADPRPLSYFLAALAVRPVAPGACR